MMSEAMLFSTQFMNLSITLPKTRILTFAEEESYGWLCVLSIDKSWFGHTPM